MSAQAIEYRGRTVFYPDSRQEGIADIDQLDLPVIEEQFGGKTAGIEALKRTLQSRDKASNSPSFLKTAPGIAIGSDWYQGYLDRLVYGLDGRAVICPFHEAFLGSHITELANELDPGTVYAVRSSGIGEGPSGRNATFFYCPQQGQERDNANDLNSIFSSLYRAHEYANPPEATIDDEGLTVNGTGVLIQPVIGNDIKISTGESEGTYFAPLLSGVMTTDHRGKPILRLAIGLGTKTVRVDTETSLFIDEHITVEAIAESLALLQFADAIDKKTGTVKQISISDSLRETALAQIQKIIAMFDCWKTLPEQLYWEFACDDSADPAYVVQSHRIPEKDRTEIVLPDIPSGTVIAESRDTLNQGRVQADWVVVIDTVDPENLWVLAEDINWFYRYLKEPYILVVPDQMLTSVAFWGDDSDLAKAGYSEFHPSFYSAAAAIIETQSSADSTITHRGGKGGSHFAAVCAGKNTLFLGIPEEVVEVSDQQEPFGKPTELMGLNNSIKIYNTQAAVTVASDGRGRFEVLEKARERKHSAIWMFHTSILIQNLLVNYPESEGVQPYVQSLNCLQHLFFNDFPPAFMRSNPLNTLHRLIENNKLHSRNENDPKQILEALQFLRSSLPRLYQTQEFQTEAARIADLFDDHFLTNPARLLSLLDDLIVFLDPTVTIPVVTSEEAVVTIERQLTMVQLRQYMEEIWSYSLEYPDDPEVSQLSELVSLTRYIYSGSDSPFDFIQTFPHDQIPAALTTIGNAIKNLWMLGSFDHHQQMRELSVRYGYADPGEYPLQAYLHKVQTLLTECLQNGV